MLEQRMPVALSQLAVMAQKVERPNSRRPEIRSQREMAARRVRPTSSPRARRWRRGRAGAQLQEPSASGHVAKYQLALAVIILPAVSRADYADAPRPRRPAGRSSRRSVSGCSTSHLGLERQHRDKTVDPERYRTRRHDLMASLERVYADLDSLDGTAHAWTSQR